MRVPVLVAAVLTAGTAFAQTGAEKYAGRPVTKVEVLIERTPTADPTLLDLIETRVGQPLSLATVRETITHLYSVGRFQDIQVDGTDASDGGVELRYSLIPIHAVERIAFSGRLGLSEGLLRDTINDRFGRTPQVARAAEVVRTLERFYQDSGYFRTSIRPESVEFHDPDRTILTFTIESGPQAKIGAIDLVGDPNVPRDDLLARLRIAPGQPYERIKLQQRLTDYVQRQKKADHLAATASHSARISDDGKIADLSLDVQPGPVVSVTFQGDPLPADRRDELVPFRREESIDQDLIEDSSQRIREYLRQQGYWKADVAVEPQQAADRLTIAFTIRKGPVYRVPPEGLEITGNKAIPIEEIRPLIVLLPGEPYVAARLDASAGAVLRLYRTRGFAWAVLKTAENEVGTEAGTGAALIRPSIAINEGPRATITDIKITGASAVSEAEVRRVMQLQPGPYYEPTVRAARDAIQLEYLNLGFVIAQVTISPTVSEDRSQVALTIDIVEGPQTLVDHVIVVGNRRIKEEVIRHEVLLRPGTPLGLRDLLESRRRLSALGLFRRFDIREIEHGPPTRRDILITVEEAPATTLGYGGGLEVQRRLREGTAGEAEERLELAPRGFFDIGRRNLWGKNRSVNLFTRASLRPKDAPGDPGADGQGVELSEYRVIGTFREPRPFQWNADFSLTGALEQGVRSSFNFTRRGVSAEVIRRVTPTIRTTVRYSFGTTKTFDERLSEEEQSRIDRLFPRVRLSIFSGGLLRDTRDDVVEPSRGTFLSGEASMATRFLGGQVGYLKTYLQGSWFRHLPGRRRNIFAARASLGLADGFPREAQPTDENGVPIPGVPPIVIEDLPASERFFAGGDATIRGFALDTVGAPNTISPRGFPRGGNAVLILNAELRLPVYKDFGAALFVDGGNVFERVTQFDLSELRGSAGFGLRYRSPIGPIRLDLGFKLDRRVVAGRLEKRQALHFSIGQAF